MCKKLLRPLLLLLVILPLPMFSKTFDVHLGAVFRKDVGGYYQNGFKLNFTDSLLLDKKIRLGFSYLSSRLGTAINSNAFKQDNYILYVEYKFLKNKLITPSARSGIGLVRVDYEDPIFSELTNTSYLIPLEISATLDTKKLIDKLPVEFQISLGANLLEGLFLSRIGTTEIIYIQTSISWKF